MPNPTNAAGWGGKKGGEKRRGETFRSGPEEAYPSAEQEFFLAGFPSRKEKRKNTGKGRVSRKSGFALSHRGGRKLKATQLKKKNRVKGAVLLGGKKKGKGARRTWGTSPGGEGKGGSLGEKNFRNGASNVPRGKGSPQYLNDVKNFRRGGEVFQS